MALTLPRGLGPLRLIIIFFLLLSVLIFRSYYLPSPHTVKALSTSSSSWLSAIRSPQVDDTSDVAADYDYSTSAFSSKSKGLGAEIQKVEKNLKEPSLDLAMEEFEQSFYSSTSSSSSSSAAVSKAASTASLAIKPTPKPLVPLVPSCRQLPGADKVVVIVKTGATEAFARLPQQLLTLADCVPNFMVFSDMEQDMGDHHVYDALDEVGKEYKDNHDDFKFYNQVRQSHLSHGDVSLLGSEKGWNLDKWKNIPMLHKAYTKYPKADWFMTIDADTYLGWTNLLLLLAQMDPNKPVYAGCVYWHGPTAFAQGGTGYLLSRAAVKKFEKIRTKEKIADWEKETSTICCGDVMLGVAMQHAGVGVSGAWPMFQVDPPSKMTWTDRYWCTPAITWHHSPTYEVEALWDFEKHWLNKTSNGKKHGSVPYLYRDAFDYFVTPTIAKEKKDWDNLSGDRIFTEPVKDHIKENRDWDGKNDEEKQKMWDELSDLQKAAAGSMKKCKEACAEDNECVQWSFHPGTCQLQKTIKLGHLADAKLETTSGWMLDRVNEFKKSKKDCKPQWEIPN